MGMHARITPSEVAEALNLHPGVRGSMLVAHRDSLGGAVLLAYVSMDPTDRTSHDELRDYLRSCFPGVETPVLFVRLECLPSLCTTRRAA